ncbi:MAG: TIM barrel protein [Nanoarchaeota archaeon]
MVQFGTGYYMPMDREYGHMEIAHDSQASSPNNKSTNDLGVGIKDIGMSLALGPVPNVPAVGAKLRAGMKTLEIGFMGAGKGSGQQQTPEYYGKVQRTALEELRKANEVNFTTHASVGISGLAGMDQQGNFSKASKNFSVQEIKRAIEFAADVAKGGPVVVHTGEFQRPLADSSWNKEGEFKDKFKMFEGEEERSSFRVVDSRTGSLISEARKSRKVSRPEWLRADQDDSDKGIKKGDYIDYFGNKVDSANKVPQYDEKAGMFKVKQMDWNDLVVEAKEMTQRVRDEFKSWDNMSKKEKDNSIWRERIINAKKNGLKSDQIEVRPEETYIIATLETNAGNSRGWALQYGGNFNENIKMIKKLEKARELYKKLEEETDPEERWKLKEKTKEFEFISPEEKFPTEIIDKILRERRHSLKHSQEASASQWTQAEESMETIRHVESAETYALKEAYDAYADAGIKAMIESQKLEKQKKLKRPIAVAMENLFPESYGSHPDELINLVQNSRKRMAELLKNRGLSEKEAQKKANDHITATFDTGHLNMWRKYWQGSPNKTIEENDHDFDKWAVKKVSQMAKAGVIGHIHLVDNYGYQDDHLAPGEGNTPIKEIVKALKDNGYKGELIVEPGADWTTDVSGFHSVMKTWKLFGSPVYGAGSGPGISSRSWSNVSYNHLGMGQSPYFVFGAYSPSEEWTLWSGVPLE